MKEFMLIIRNEGDAKADMSAEQQQQFLNACRIYIEDLKKKGQLKNAQPLVREGTMISATKTPATPDSFTENPWNETTEILVGYYHILANDITEAITIAKANPEFAFVKGAKVEVRPIKTKEASTNYEYPSGQ
ncbi:YciI family protein [Puia sp. P3]|uniref:YciI family protein n=1 Tax=Puia sp. P3 TaxID=3423952 RepID=UPI003D668E84